MNSVITKKNTSFQPLLHIILAALASLIYTVVYQRTGFYDIIYNILLFLFGSEWWRGLQKAEALIQLTGTVLVTPLYLIFYWLTNRKSSPQLVKIGAVFAAAFFVTGFLWGSLFLVIVFSGLKKGFL